MKGSRSILFGIFLITIATVAGFGQAQPATSRIVVVDTSAFFNEKTGIIKIVNASRQLNAELAPRRSEVQQLISRVESIEKDLLVFRTNAGKGIPIDEKAAQAKVDEAAQLKREGKYKEDDYNSFAQQKQAQVVGPAYSDALRVLGEYIKTKGYGMVFDVSKDQAGILIFAAEQYDITKDFITFYNSRPPTAINSVPK